MTAGAAISHASTPRRRQRRRQPRRRHHGNVGHEAGQRRGGAVAAQRGSVCWRLAALRAGTLVAMDDPAVPNQQVT
eukprot:CAMPEP_0183582504 /NCGR_PEP_ID=MMETSP0371-20130417/149818_1 /TAXON_ID=268820 /ORGANISM="Peridinium aciculiferum, Strain PAER-2" /LENGTH=75 /DNA_ID=CAMNT_0025793249 /DNA_START=51 /DNA_END=275 /DNA_ORIENTATION=-